MFHFDLRIVTCGLSKDIVNMLKTISNENNFTNTFISVNKLCAADLNNSDIYIYGGPITKEATQILIAKKTMENTYKVIYAPMEKLRADDYSLAIAMDEVWPYPLSLKALKGYFVKLLNRVRHDFEQNLSVCNINTLDIWNMRGEIKPILNTVPTPIILFNAHLNVSCVNAEFCKVFNIKEKDILNKKGLEQNSLLIPGLSITKMQYLSPDIIQYTFVKHHQDKDFVFRGMLHNLHNNRGIQEGSLLLLTDLTEEHETIERNYRLSITDGLTGVFNRTYYRSMVEQRVVGKSDYVLVLVDLDKLKGVNDNFGHSSGDDYIVRTTTLLKLVFGEQGTICRIGGDEFAVFVDQMDTEQVKAALQQVNDELAKLALPYPASISYGFEHLHVDTFEAFRKASNALDKKLYAMKELKHIVGPAQADLDI